MGLQKIMCGLVDSFNAPALIRALELAIDEKIKDRGNLIVLYGADESDYVARARRLRLALTNARQEWEKDEEKKSKRAIKDKASRHKAAQAEVMRRVRKLEKDTGITKSPRR